MADTTMGMADSTVASIFNGAFQLGNTALGNALNYKYQRKLNTQAFKQQTALDAYRAQLNRIQSDYEYERNSPKNQMSRFAEAGLNPNLIYGQGSNAQTPYQLQGFSAGSVPGDYTYHGDWTRMGDAVTTAMNTYFRSKEQEANLELAGKAAIKQDIENMYAAQKLANDFNVDPQGRVLDPNTTGKIAQGFDLQKSKQEAEIKNMEKQRQLQEQEMIERINQSNQQLQLERDKLEEQKRQFNSNTETHNKEFKQKMQQAQRDYDLQLKKHNALLQQQEHERKISEVEHQWEMTVKAFNDGEISEREYDRRRKAYADYVRDHKLDTHYNNVLKGMSAVGGLVNDIGSAFKPNIHYQERHYHTDNANIYTGKGK